MSSVATRTGSVIGVETTVQWVVGIHVNTRPMVRDVSVSGNSQSGGFLCPKEIDNTVLARPLVERRHSHPCKRPRLGIRF